MSSPTEKLSTGASAATRRNRTVGDSQLFEEELLQSEAAETLNALLAASNLRQKDLASRLELGEPRVSRLLKGDANTTLRALANAAWALGYRFEVVPVPLEDREQTPARDDAPPPAWVGELGRHVGEQTTAKRRRLIRPKP